MVRRTRGPVACLRACVRSHRPHQRPLRARAPVVAAAYTKGYQDAKAGAPFDPITDAPVESGSDGASSGGGFGIGKLMNMLMLGGMVYQLGGGGRWSGPPRRRRTVAAPPAEP